MKRLAPSALALGAFAALLLTTAALVHRATAPVAAPAEPAEITPAYEPPPAAPRSGLNPSASSAARATPRHDRERTALVMRADGLTLAGALAGIGRHAAGRLPDHNRWLFRVSGYLALHPERCRAFAAAALTADATGEMQALAADVLAGVGHGPAQAALRDLIDQSALGPAVRHRLLQSHLQLRTPDPEAADWLARHLDDPDVGPAAVNALGAVAGRLAATHPVEADAAMKRLEQGLARAETAEMQRAHLLALGNSGLPGAEAALPFIERDDPDLRAAAARALRHLDTAEARDGLHRLALDPDPRVRTRAVEALGERLTPGDSGRLARATRDGRLGSAAESALLAAALRADDGAPARMELLDALAEDAAEPRVRERARMALLAVAP